MATKYTRDAARDLAEIWRIASETDREIKTAPARLTKTPTDGRGVFTAVVSTIGPPPDADGDIIEAGAFDRTIREAYARRGKRNGKALWPLSFMHQVTNPSMIIGSIAAATMAENELVVEGRLNIESSTKAMETHQLMLEDSITEFSIGYAVIGARPGMWRGKAIRYLEELDGWRSVP